MQQDLYLQFDDDGMARANEPEQQGYPPAMHRGREAISGGFVTAVRKLPRIPV
jgi:hypothetical protein